MNPDGKTKYTQPEVSDPSGHRARLRNRYIEAGGFSGFTQEQILEMLLFFVIERQDTHKTAKRILDRFGTVYAAVTAPESELASVEGVGETAAGFLKSLFWVYQMYGSRPERIAANLESDFEVKICSERFLEDAGEDAILCLGTVGGGYAICSLDGENPYSEAAKKAKEAGISECAAVVRLRSRGRDISEIPASEIKSAFREQGIKLSALYLLSGGNLTHL